MKDLKAFFKKDSFNLLVLILSFIILLIGTFVVNILVALLIFIAINLIWIIPFIKWKKKLDNRNKIKKNIKPKVSDETETLDLDNEEEKVGKINMALEERSEKWQRKKKEKTVKKVRRN